MSGQRVRTMMQNQCRITVKDSSKTQNFHLVGPGVDLRTKVSATGTRTWTVNFRPGTYVYHSDKNAKLRGSFKVYRRHPGVRKPDLAQARRRRGEGRSHASIAAR